MEKYIFIPEETELITVENWISYFHLSQMENGNIFVSALIPPKGLNFKSIKFFWGEKEVKPIKVDWLGKYWVAELPSGAENEKLTCIG